MDTYIATSSCNGPFNEIELNDKINPFNISIIVFMVIFLLIVGLAVFLTRMRKKSDGDVTKQKRPFRIVAITVLILVFLFGICFTYVTFFANAPWEFVNSYGYTKKECNEARKKSAEGAERCRNNPPSGITCEY